MGRGTQKPDYASSAWATRRRRCKAAKHPLLTGVHLSEKDVDPSRAKYYCPHKMLTLSWVPFLSTWVEGTIFRRRAFWAQLLVLIVLIALLAVFVDLDMDEMEFFMDSTTTARSLASFLRAV